MSPEYLTKLLAAGREEDPERSPACPDEHEIAGYVDGTLDASACEPLERHVADCSHCLALVGLLSRERDSAPVAPKASAAARAAMVGGWQRRWWLAPQWAVAATLILAVPLLLQLAHDLDGGVEGRAGPGAPATRSFAPAEEGLQVLAPGAGLAVDPATLVFTWTEVAGSPFYDVRVVTDAGDVVVQQRVAGTSWRPPAQLRLQAGAEYYVLVDAYPEGDKAVTSHHVPFRIAD